ncbi:MAG: hypothetical protein E7467_01445 [Ruminococcaceae bacterium]|nr:hypothetical protein [Oscillospiraceae bacterium]
MREIGGYLELDKPFGKEYYPEAIKLNSAQNAVAYLNRVKKISKLYLPYYLCDSVVGMCHREGIDYELYHVDKDFLPLFDKNIGETERFYIVNFYGQLSREQLLAYPNVIVDNVHAFFTPPMEGVDTLCSCRKYFGVPDGAYLISNAPRIALEQDRSYARMRHILGRYDCACASEHYGSFQSNEDEVLSMPLRQMSALTQHLLSSVDYAQVKAARQANWQTLHEALGERNGLRLRTPPAPYMYPFYTERGGQLRSALAAQKIYIPTLWPNVLTGEASDIEKDYARNILPLPIDQRYDQKDMERIIEALL